MKQIHVKIKLGERAVMPEYATSLSAGVDIRACVIDSIIVKPEEIVIVPTGLFIQLPEGFEAQVRPRSGLAAKYGITVLNTPGTIDADYTGEIKVILKNCGKEDFFIQHNDRIAQLVFNEVPKAIFEYVAELSETERGAGGFGHTGVK